MAGRKVKGQHSVFTAADNIRYRGYVTAIQTKGGKARPLSKAAWVQAGRPTGTGGGAHEK